MSVCVLPAWVPCGAMWYSLYLSGVMLIQQYVMTSFPSICNLQGEPTHHQVWPLHPCHFISPRVDCPPAPECYCLAIFTDANNSSGTIKDLSVELPVRFSSPESSHLWNWTTLSIENSLWQSKKIILWHQYSRLDYKTNRDIIITLQVTWANRDVSWDIQKWPVIWECQKTDCWLNTSTLSRANFWRVLISEHLNQHLKIQPFLVYLQLSFKNYTFFLKMPKAIGGVKKKVIWL